LANETSATNLLGPHCLTDWLDSRLFSFCVGSIKLLVPKLLLVVKCRKWSIIGFVAYAVMKVASGSHKLRDLPQLVGWEGDYFSTQLSY